MEENQTTATGRNRLIRWMIAYAIVFTVLLLISNIKAINTWTSYVVAIFRPVIIGLVIAYLINPFFRFFERKMLAKIPNPYLRRILAMLLAYLLLFLVIFALIMLIVPNLIRSIQGFVNNFDTRLPRLITPINQLIGKLNEWLPKGEDDASFIPLLDMNVIKQSIKQLGDYVLNFLQEKIGFSSIPRLWDFLRATASSLASVVFALFLSIYLLYSKEKRYAQIMKFRRALFKDSTNERITHVCTVADRSFGGFLRGKILDSLIVGILTYLACRIFNIEDALLIATIVGITDIIPVIGPFIGVIPTAVIILLDDPVKVIFFLVSIIIIQQVDGNIIAPKILGENTGVSSLCVMISIIIMGGLWKFTGMLIGVPLFATVLELLDFWLDSRLKDQKLPEAVDSYSPNAVIRRSETAFERRRRKRAQKRQAQILNEETGTGDLNLGERMRLRTYQTALKYHLFSDISEDDLQNFLQEENPVPRDASAVEENTSGKEGGKDE